MSLNFVLTFCSIIVLSSGSSAYLNFVWNFKIIVWTEVTIRSFYSNHDLKYSKHKTKYARRILIDFMYSWRKVLRQSIQRRRTQDSKIEQFQIKKWPNIGSSKRRYSYSHGIKTEIETRTEKWIMKWNNTLMLITLIWSVILSQIIKSSWQNRIKNWE